jgi:hypothetical protein
MLKSSSCVGLIVAFGLLGCDAVRPAPVVRNTTMRIPPGTLDKVAVVPFYPKETLAKYSSEGVSPAAAAELVARFMTEALARRGIRIVAPSDLEIAFVGQGIPAPRLDPKAAAELAAHKFGATAVMLGQVSRYRERGGESYGSSRAASVAFEVSIYTAPTPRRVWTSKFDETQRALSENVFNAPRYPGGGMRWLTAAELAKWGADSAAASLPLSR